MIEKCLNALYRLCGFLSAVFLAMIAVLTMMQIVARQMGIPMETIELSGFCLAASTFFGLAYTLVHGEHIRVGFAENSNKLWVRRGSDLWACTASFVMISYAGWHMGRYTFESYSYGDLSPGIMAMPMWIPQSAVTAGLGLLAIALLHQVVRLVTGRSTLYDNAARATSE